MSLINMKLHKGESLDPIPADKVTEVFASSLALGFALMMIAYWTGKKINQLSKKPSHDERSNEMDHEDIADHILGASNFLFICFGMTALMLMVDNNIARAFALGSAIALIRFRIKIGNKSTAGTSLLFAILTGMACGVEQIYAALGIVTVFLCLQLTILSFIGFEPTLSREISEGERDFG